MNDAPHPPAMMLFDGPTSQRGYAFNRFAKTLTRPDGRAAFLADPRGTMQAMGVGETEMAAVAARDWTALLACGASIYLIAKVAIALGLTLNHVGAQMRGESIEDFDAAIRARQA